RERIDVDHRRAERRPGRLDVPNLATGAVQRAEPDLEGVAHLLARDVELVRNDDGLRSLADLDAHAVGDAAVGAAYVRDAVGARAQLAGGRQRRHALVDHATGRRAASRVHDEMSGRVAYLHLEIR